MVGDGSHILFWHDRWIGDTSLKMIYLQLYACSNDKEAFISDQEGGNNRFWNLRFYRNFHERELEAAFSFLDFIQSRIPRGIGCDSPHWCLNGNGKFDIQSFYNKIRGTSLSSFPWKGIWKVKVPKMVAFFMWTAAHGRILTLDNLMLQGLPLVNRCCMCCCNEEFVDHLLHCPVAHSLWVQMLQVFKTQWVMPGSAESLVFCWSNWLGKFSLDIWNMILGCLMYVVWIERNQRSFEAKEKSLV